MIKGCRAPARLSSLDLLFNHIRKLLGIDRPRRRRDLRLAAIGSVFARWRPFRLRSRGTRSIGNRLGDGLGRYSVVAGTTAECPEETDAQKTGRERSNPKGHTRSP